MFCLGYFFKAYQVIKATMPCLFVFSKLSMLDQAGENSLFNHAYLLILYQVLISYQVRI